MAVQDEDHDWVLTFRPGKSDVPAAIRVRRLLKIAGRSLSLRCVRVESASGEALDGPYGASARPDAADATPGAADGAGGAMGK